MKSTTHDHTMKKIAPSGAWCDGGCRGRCDDERWNCSEGCNYDLCMECMSDGEVIHAPAATEAAATTRSSGAPLGTIASIAQHVHPLKKIEGGGSSCDVCHTRGLEERWQCSEGCNWDACGACLLANPDAVVAVAAASTAAAPTLVATAPPAASASTPTLAAGVDRFEPTRLFDTPDADGESGSGYVGAALFVRCVGLDYVPTRRDHTGAAIVALAVEQQQFRVLEYGIMWHLERFEGAVQRLIEGVPEAEDDFEHKRSFGRDDAEKTVSEIADKFSCITTWLRRFLNEHGHHEVSLFTVTF